MKHLTILILTLIILNSCVAAYKIQTKSFRDFDASSTVNKAFVINKDSLLEEYKILKHSKLFEFTNDSTNAIKIKLHQLKRLPQPSCGNLMTGSMLTLGQLPARFPETYIYRFDLIENENVAKKEIQLKIDQHLWFWNIFSNKKNFNKQAGIVLRGSLAK
ncbi:hypothetical protein [uncultured Psychroserpens sp.]|uniref:hypothetical protein n=1 Tax=uncultured Psychroserpens sp. TaxID=255436 RepID=UPI002619DB46|nr:hypothetical protein [uncultured Psychroserpens sp.]